MSRHRCAGGRRAGRAGRGPAALVLGLVVVSLGLLLAGLVVLLPAGTGVPAATATAAPTASTVPPQADRPGAVPAPTALDIPSIDAHSSLVAAGLRADRSIAVPSVETPQQAAWYSGSPRPGATGPAVVVGHVNGGGRDGVFVDLHEVEPGAEVLVTRADRSVAVFAVTRVDTVAKATFPTRAVYGDTAGPELRLITCGGAFDATARSYEANVVVYARLSSVRPAGSAT